MRDNEDHQDLVSYFVDCMGVLRTLFLLPALFKSVLLITVMYLVCLLDDPNFTSNFQRLSKYLWVGVFQD